MKEEPDEAVDVPTATEGVFRAPPEISYVAGRLPLR
jgi:hypothetical protein